MSDDLTRFSPRTPAILPVGLSTPKESYAGMQSDYSRRTHTQLVRDVNAAHDKFKKLKADSDEEIAKLRHDLRWGQWKRWLIGLAVITGWELLRTLVHH